MYSIFNSYRTISIILLLCVVSATSFVFIPCVNAEETTYVWSNQSHKLETAATSTSMSGSTNDTITNNSLGLEAESACLMEQSTGLVIYDHNMHEQLRPASVTKVMSLLLIMEALDSGRISLTDKVPCTEDAAAMGGSQIWLDVRETLTVDEMLKAICVVSANDCVVAMADYLEGSQEAFVNKMNNRASELGMNDTCFKNCHGIDEDGHVTSAYDIAIMSRELMINHPSITNYTTIYMDSLRDGKSSLVNTNKLVKNYSGCTGLKTGSTSIALYNLSATATRNGLSLIGVVMKAPTSALRFSNATSLLNYGFNNYSYKAFGNKGDTLKAVTVSKGVSQEVNAIYESSPSFLIKNGVESNITYEINLNENIQAPVAQGQLLGTIKYSLNGSEIKTINLIAETSVEKITLTTMAKSILTSWFSLLRL